MDQLSLADWAFRLSIISFFVSCCSCIIALQQLQANRRHQRLSVSPCFSTSKDFDDDKQRGKTSIIITLENKGLGPAIVEQVSVFVGNEEVKADINEMWGEALKVLSTFKGKGIPYDYVCTVIAPNHCISPKDRIELLRLSSFPEHREGIEDFANKCRIKIRYRTFYEESFEYSTDLHYAARAVVKSKPPWQHSTDR